MNINGQAFKPLSKEDEALKRKTAADWDLSGSSSVLQDQLDEMARWYLLKHPEFVEFIRKNDAAMHKYATAAEAFEEIKFYPGVKAIAAHEIAHHFFKGKEKRYSNDILRKFSEVAHTQTGVDIPYGVNIGTNCFIDHSTGTVIGETASIGNNAVIYHNVTFGAYGKARDLQHRHPEVGNGCIISSGVQILGSIKIGDNVKIGPGTKLLGNNIKVRNGAKIGASTTIYDNNIIGDGVWIGDDVVIQERVGEIRKEEITSITGKDQNGNILFGIPSHSEVSRKNGRLCVTATRQQDNAGQKDAVRGRVYLTLINAAREHGAKTNGGARGY